MYAKFDMDDSKEEFVLKDFHLFGAMANLILAGYVLFQIFIFVLIVISTWSGSFIGAIVLGIFFLVLLFSIRRTIKFLAIKKIKFTEDELEIRYVKFGQLFFCTKIEWRNVKECFIEDSANVNDKSSIKNRTIKLKIHKKTLLLGIAIEENLAFKLRDKINIRLKRL